MKTVIENQTFVATLNVAQFKEIMKEVYQTSTMNLPPNHTSSVCEKRTLIKGIRGLATHIGCGLNSAQKLKNGGVVPYSKYGNRLIFYSNEVDAALRQKGGENEQL